MSCKLKHKESLLNSRDFLIEQGAIDKKSSILNTDKFNQANTQLTEDTLNAYGVQGTLWIDKDSRAIPNHSVLKQIDNKRKELGIYDSQDAGQVTSITITEPDEDFIEPEIIEVDYSNKDFEEQRDAVKQDNQSLSDVSLKSFDELFPDYDYLDDYEKELLIKSIEEGYLSINCKI